MKILTNKAYKLLVEQADYQTPHLPRFTKEDTVWDGYCPKCGTGLEENVDFTCPVCGQLMKWYKPEDI